MYPSTGWASPHSSTLWRVLTVHVDYILLWWVTECLLSLFFSCHPDLQKNHFWCESQLNLICKWCFGCLGAERTHSDEVIRHNPDRGNEYSDSSPPEHNGGNIKSVLAGLLLPISKQQGRSRWMVKNLPHHFSTQLKGVAVSCSGADRMEKNALEGVKVT
jgi:hypothetical protein